MLTQQEESPMCSVVPSKQTWWLESWAALGPTRMVSFAVQWRRSTEDCHFSTGPDRAAADGSTCG